MFSHLLAELLREAARAVPMEIVRPAWKRALWMSHYLETGSEMLETKAVCLLCQQLAVEAVPKEGLGH